MIVCNCDDSNGAWGKCGCIEANAHADDRFGSWKEDRKSVCIRFHISGLYLKSIVDLFYIYVLIRKPVWRSGSSSA